MRKTVTGQRHQWPRMRTLVRSAKRGGDWDSGAALRRLLLLLPQPRRAFPMTLLSVNPPPPQYLPLNQPPSLLPLRPSVASFLDGELDPSRPLLLLLFRQFHLLNLHRPHLLSAGIRVHHRHLKRLSTITIHLLQFVELSVDAHQRTVPPVMTLRTAPGEMGHSPTKRTLRHRKWTRGIR